MKALADLAAFGRFARGLRGFLRPTNSQACRELLLRRQAGAADSFVALVRDGIYANPRSPYLPMLRRAGADFADIESQVARDGVEATLSQLLDAGVYLRVDEAKGRVPIRRGDLEIHADPADFDNPRASRHLDSQTSGSSGRPHPVAIDLDGWLHDSAAQLLFLEGWEVTDRPRAVWRPVPPAGSGIERVLELAKLRLQPEHWFSQQRPGLRSTGFRAHAVTRTAWAACRLYGAAIPFPEYLPLERAEAAARWLARHRDAGRPAYFDTYVSSALRVCAAAADAGLDISGSFFRVGSEPFTATRADFLKRAGVRASCHFAMAETGVLGFGCSDPHAVDDVHLVAGKYAAVLRDRRPGDSIDRPGSLYLTSLRSGSSKVLLNMETGDCVQRTLRRCGCPLGEVGFDVHLHDIHSHEKLTSEGMHFLGTQLLTLLEEVLPARLGGAPADYQLVEEERDGLPVVTLRIHPRVGPVDESRAIVTALDFLADGGPGLRLQRELWTQAGTLRVERLPPRSTPAAKVLPLVRKNSS